jgi:two-component system, chemotaxis family, chemotaxis protein CheY
LKTVLVVDDSETVRHEIARALEKAGFAVIEARDGVEALAVADRSTLNMVILDVNMPRLNGLDMLEKLMANPKHRNLPVLMLTTEAQPSMIARAKKAGAKAWVIKPLKADQLVSVVNKLAS